MCTLPLCAQEHAANKHLRFMRAWWTLNPEYEYRFFTDAQCAAFVSQHASEDEMWAYRAVTTGEAGSQRDRSAHRSTRSELPPSTSPRILAGAQRADLFRGIYLQRTGGVYADLDCELAGPLRGLVPPHATAVSNPSWSVHMRRAGPPARNPSWSVHALRLGRGPWAQVTKGCIKGRERTVSWHARIEPRPWVRPHVRLTQPLRRAAQDV